jgi:hypothetical protein
LAQGKEQDIAFLKDMIPGLSTVAAVLAMEKNYYNMVRIILLFLSFSE